MEQFGECTSEQEAPNGAGQDNAISPENGTGFAADEPEAAKPAEPAKPTKYFIDFENVHGAGLKGVDELDAEDEVFIFYSQAAETFHIEHAIDIMKSKARIEFVEIDGGTRNSLDFQLVAALFGTMDEDHDYAIVSGDGGFDAAIKMGARLKLPSVRRISDLTGSTEQPPTKSRQSRQRKKQGAAQQQKQKQSDADRASAQQGAPAQDVAKQQHSDSAQNAETDRHDASPNPKPPVQQKLPSGRKRRRLPAPQEDPADKETPAQAAQSDDSGENAQAGQGAQDDRNGSDAEQSDGQTAPTERGGRYSKRKEIKALLVENGVELNQQQLASVMKALNGVKNKQDFYRRIIKSERQERGLKLYRDVKDYYEQMVEILR